MQNFKTVAQALLGETAHFGFCPPKIGFFRGLGGAAKIYFLLESSYFCYLGTHAKIWNPTINPYRVLSNGTNNNTNKKKIKISASTDGGPRSRVRARGTLRSAPHRR